MPIRVDFRRARTGSDAAAEVPFLAAKVPEITAAFWITKLVSTAMGEALSDFLDGGSGFFPVLGVLAALVAFVVALRMQLRRRRYVTGVYWLAVAMVATFGTMAADALHQALGTPYWLNALFYALVLGAIFWRWYATEGTLSIHSITTPRRERYYWATVLATFALGTAAGDMTAVNLHLGFLASIYLFAGLMVVPAVAYGVFHANAIATFWFAYIVTRPLGASVADWLDVSRHRGGVGLGTGPVSASLVVLMAALVYALSVRERAARGQPDTPGVGAPRSSTVTSQVRAGADSAN